MSKPKILEPTPYPSRITPNIIPQKPINSTDSQTQLNFVKNELFSLENKYDNLMKLFSKSEKKLKDQSEELKKIKQSNEFLNKENNINKITIQKLNNEKNSLLKIIEENKKYILKIENKLIKGVKNQFLIEQNKSLKERIDILEIENKKINDKEEYINNEKKNISNQAKIIQKAMQIKVEEIKNYFENENKNKNKNKNDNNINENENENNKNIIINEEIIYDIGKIKNENEELKIKNEKLNKDFEEISNKYKNIQEKIQEINFAKSTLTKMIIEKDNIINEMTLNKKEYENNINKLKEEKNILQIYINDLEKKQKEEEQKKLKNEEEEKRIKEENKKKEEESILNINSEKNMIKDYQIKIQMLEYANKDLSEKLSLANNQIDILEKSLENISQKNKKIEKSYKENITQNTIFLNEVKTLKTESENQNIAFNKLKLSNEKNISIINELNNKLHEYEKENIKLISKLNKQIFEKDYVENNLIKQNNEILIYNKEQEEKINKLIDENNLLNQEKNQYKKLFEQIYNHSNKLIKEKNISIIRQQIKDIKNISNGICYKNNYKSKENNYNYDYCIENYNYNNKNNLNIIENSEITENEEKNNGGKFYEDIKEKKMIVDNTNDNTNDNKSLTPIHRNNNISFITYSIEENNSKQNKSYNISNSGSEGKPDKILEMIRKERNKKKKLDDELKKIENYN